MSAGLYLAQRATAAILGVAVMVHLATIAYAVRGGLTAGEILDRTSGDLAVFAFYAIFVFAAAIHAPIGLRSVLREWTVWRGRSLDVAALGFSGIILVLGLRAAYAVYSA